MLLLHAARVPAGYAARVCHYFAPETTEVHALISDHPYRLTEVRGSGLGSVDLELAAALCNGIP